METNANNVSDYHQQMEPIVLVDQRKKQETHIIVAPHYSFDDVLRSARRINVGLFEGNWDLAYLDPQTQQLHAVQNTDQLDTFLTRNIQTFYWQYQHSAVDITWQKLEQSLRNIKAEPFSPVSQGKKGQQGSFVPQTLEYASLSRRVVANVIDLFIITFIVSFLHFGFWGTLLTAWFYFAGMESSKKRQATFGKRYMGLKVADENGKPLSFERTSGRFFGKLITAMTFFVGFLMALVTRRKQTMHDLLSSSLVLDTRHSHTAVPVVANTTHQRIVVQ